MRSLHIGNTHLYDIISTAKQRRRLLFVHDALMETMPMMIAVAIFLLNLGTTNSMPRSRYYAVPLACRSRDTAWPLRESKASY